MTVIPVLDNDTGEAHIEKVQTFKSNSVTMRFTDANAQRKKLCTIIGH
jgi:hypothetical protein